MFAPHVADAPRCRVHAKHAKCTYFQVIFKHFTLWRVGKRAFLRILQWENGKIRRKRAFSPSGEWENVHVRPARRGCTPVPRTCKIRQKRAFRSEERCEEEHLRAL